MRKITALGRGGLHRRLTLEEYQEFIASISGREQPEQRMRSRGLIRGGERCWVELTGHGFEIGSKVRLGKGTTSTEDFWKVLQETFLEDLWKTLSTL